MKKIALFSFALLTAAFAFNACTKSDNVSEQDAMILTFRRYRHQPDLSEELTWMPT